MLLFELLSDKLPKDYGSNDTIETTQAILEVIKRQAETPINRWYEFFGNDRLGIKTYKAYFDFGHRSGPYPDHFTNPEMRKIFATVRVPATGHGLPPGTLSVIAVFQDKRGNLVAARSVQVIGKKILGVRDETEKGAVIQMLQEYI